MTSNFYDVKLRKSVTAEVTDKKEYKSSGGTRYALRGKTSDGRNLTKFVNKMDYDKAMV